MQRKQLDSLLNDDVFVPSHDLNAKYQKMQTLLHEVGQQCASPKSASSAETEAAFCWHSLVPGGCDFSGIHGSNSCRSDWCECWMQYPLYPCISSLTTKVLFSLTLGNSLLSQPRKVKAWLFPEPQHCWALIHLFPSCLMFCAYWSADIYLIERTSIEDIRHKICSVSPQGKHPRHTELLRSSAPDLPTHHL